MSIKRAILITLLALGMGTKAFGQSAWEYLGPEGGFHGRDDLCVTENAVYVGMSEDADAGLGLFRFDGSEWSVFAFEGHKIVGVRVWGANDEHLLVREWGGPEDLLKTWRSEDRGQSWGLAGAVYGVPLAQADSQPDQMICEEFYSADGGWTWNGSNLAGYTIIGHGQAFDPNNDSIAYYTAGLTDESYRIYKSTNGGVMWSEVWLEGFRQLLGIDVEWHDSDHVMACYGIENRVLITSDAGQDWAWKPSSFYSREVLSPPWAPACFFVAGSAADETTYEVWWTSDLGDTWTSYSEGLPTLPGPFWGSWIRIQAHPVDPVLYVALEPSGVWRLDLSGVSGIESESTYMSDPRLVSYPNPSNGDVTIAFQGQGAAVLRSICVVDVMGRVVQTLQAGSDEVTLRWDGRDRGGREVASGVYRVVYFRPEGQIGGSQRVLILR